jgi:tetratricopeptide (TPR) repeat protein
MFYSASASADFASIDQGKTAGASVFWMSRSSEVAGAMKAWERGAVETAVRLAKRALRDSLSPSDHETALYFACVGQTRLGHPEAALRFCSQAVELSEVRDWRHLNNHANALLQAGHVAEAIAEYERAIAVLDADISSGRTDDEVSPDAPGQTVSAALDLNLNLARRRQAAGLEGMASVAPPASDGGTRLAESGKSRP